MLSLNTENKVELKYDDKLGLVHTIIHVSGKFYLSDEFNNRILAFNESGILEHE